MGSRRWRAFWPSVSRHIRTPESSRTDMALNWVSDFRHCSISAREYSSVLSHPNDAA